MNSLKHYLKYGLLGCLMTFITSITQAAGLLTPTNNQLGELEIREHHVDVVIDNGYVTTSIDQTFYNPHPQDLEAIYSFPVPEKAAVGEFTYWIDGKPIVGEVVEKQQARTIYEQEKQAGREAALVEKDEYKTFDIAVSPVRANDSVRIRLVYIQAAHVDTSVGRYVYPLEDGGIDEVKNAFWSRNEVVTEKFSFNLRLRSGYPVDAVRLPQHNAATVSKINDQEWAVNLATFSNSTNNQKPNEISTNEKDINESIPSEASNKNMGVANLDRDILVYWRLAENLPGAMELITHREPNKTEGTFMLTLTPGDDLNHLQQGKDWVFVLDISGSMQGKYNSLVEGVRQGLKKLRPSDRFKVVLFNNNTIDFTQGFVAVTEANIEPVLKRLENHNPGGGTNLYAGLKKGLTGLDADRSSAIILVTDGVANVGTTEKRAFTKLLKKQDVRLFTFVMGNSANRPLLDEMTKVSNGFAQSISNADDMTGQILLAAQKMTHESLRNISVDIKGLRTNDLTPKKISSLYRGEQLVILGHFIDDGSAGNNSDNQQIGTITIKGKSGDREQIYKADMNFNNGNQNPELERLWAFGMIEHLQSQLDYYQDDNADTKQAITDIAKQYGLVTNYTSMIVVREEVLQQLGINPSNKQRVEREQLAREAREQNPSASQTNQKTVSSTPRPVLTNNSNGGSSGGGALPLWFVLFMFGLVFHQRFKR